MTHRPKGWWVLYLWANGSGEQHDRNEIWWDVSRERARRSNTVADIVLGRLEERPVVVVSAMAGVTDSTVGDVERGGFRIFPEASKLLRRFVSGTWLSCPRW